MPNFNTQVLDVDGTAKHYIVMSVVDHIVKIFGLKAEEYVLNSPYNNSMQAGSNAGIQRHDNFGQTDRLFIDVDERRESENINNRAAGRAIEQPFFNNSQYDIRFHPAYANFQFQLTLRVRTPSRAMANVWINKLHRMASQGGDAFTVEANYHYNVPDILLALLTDLFNAGQIKGTKADFGKFLRAGFAPAVTYSDGTFIVRQTPTRLICTVESPADIKAERADQDSAWEGTMNISFSAQVPDSVDVVYPPIVSNSLIGTRWWQPMLNEGESDETDAVKDDVTWAQDQITIMEDLIPLPVYLIPCDFPDAPKGTRKKGEYALILSYFELEQADIDAGVIEYDLKDLGEKINLSPRMIEYIIASYAKRPWGPDSIIHVYTYDNGNECDRDASSIDQEAYYSITRKLDIDRLYSTAITVMTDFTYLSEDGKEILKQFPDILIDVIVDFRPDIVNKYPGIDNPGGGWPSPDFGGGWIIWDPDHPGWGKLPDDVFEDIYNDLIDPNRPEGSLYRTGMLTITNNRILIRGGR